MNVHPFVNRALVALGYLFVALGAVLTPLAYALDWLDTLPAIAVALLLIAVGVALAMLGDRMSERLAEEDSGPEPTSSQAE